MKKARIAILGQGRSGRDIHGAYIKKRPELYEVVAIVEPMAQRRERAAAEWPGAVIYADHAELYGRTDIDLVVNATPSPLHVAVTMDLLAHGFNTLTEKPFARYPYEVEQLIHESKKQGKLLAIFQQSRFCAYYQKMLEIIESGVLGRLVMVSARTNTYNRRWDWQTVQENNAGTMLNTGPHPMDQALNVLGFPDPESVQILSRLDKANTFGDAEDFAKVLLTAPGLPVLDYEVSCCDAYTPYIFHLQGTCGNFMCTTKDAKWRYFMPREAKEQKLILEPLCAEDGTPAYCSEQLTWYEEAWQADEQQADIFDDATDKLYRSVIAALFEGKDLVVTPEQVWCQISVMARVHEQNPMPRLKLF